jgi:hypothetical protein
VRYHKTEGVILAQQTFEILENVFVLEEGGGEGEGGREEHTGSQGKP